MSTTHTHNANPVHSSTPLWCELGYEGLSERDYYFYLNNIQSYPDFLPTASQLANKFLHAAERRQLAPDLAKNLQYFDYTPARLDARLQQILWDYADRYAQFDVERRASATSRQRIIAALCQFAPTNLIDGAWLKNIPALGLETNSQGLLHSIWLDESGDGNSLVSHAEIYRRLLRSVGAEMPEAASRAFVHQQALHEDAFTNPVFQLAVAQFPQILFPELLGMTLFYEWDASVSSLPVVKLLEHPSIGIDAYFFKLHMEIDNVDNGHAAAAREAVVIQLEETRRAHGEDAMQREWRRIWNGYVAFATTGKLLTRCDVVRTKCKGGINIENVG